MKLRELRKQSGMTVEQLGKLVGLSKGTISLYENGKHYPDIDMLRKFADIFGVTVDELLGDEKIPPRPVLTDTDIRFALSGGEEPITPAQYNEVKQFVRFIRERDSGGNK